MRQISFSACVDVGRVDLFEVPPAEKTSSAFLAFVLESRTLLAELGLFLEGGYSVCRRVACRSVGIKNSVSALLIFPFEIWFGW
jgi:hypothetical protein